MLFSFFYEATLWLLALVFFPKMLYQRVFKGKYRTSFSRRFGRHFPQIDKQGKRLVWIHAVSMGETKAIAELAKSLLEEDPDTILVISSVTETGHQEAKKTLSFAHYHVFLPFDFKWIINPLVKRVQPDLVLFSETDLWYNFMKAAKKQGAKIGLVNGKISPRTFDRLGKFSFFSKKLFSCIDLFCVQGEEYKRRFELLGVPKEKVVVTGNIKLDAALDELSGEAKMKLRHRLGIQEDDLVLVAGSTHDPEESIILEAALSLRGLYPNLKVVVVPRHPERFSVVSALLSSLSIPFHRLSDTDKDPKSFVILVDAMGLLKQCYQIADVAIVAGSFTKKVGGHNIIEPCAYGVPVVFGPHLFTQPDFLFLVEEYQSGLQTDAEMLASTLKILFSSRAKRKELGSNGKKLVQDMRGATGKTLQALVQTLFLRNQEKEVVRN